MRFSVIGLDQQAQRPNKTIVKTFKPATIVQHPGGNSASYYSVHCRPTTFRS